MKHIKRLVTTLAASAMTCIPQSFAAPPKAPAEIDGIHCASEKDYEWWRDCRFGIFVHWGPGALVQGNSLPWKKIDGRPTWHQLGYMADHKKSDELSVDQVSEFYKKYKRSGKDGVPSKAEIYNSLYKIFKADAFDAEKIAQMAVDAGAGYVVFTTKHHDGFCMWDSALTDYDMMSSPVKRDICKELADACHKRGLKLLWYYSVVDMRDARYDLKNPKPYEDYMFAQIEELLTKYGDIEGMWWDGGKIEKDNARLFKMMNKIHPGILTNGRIGKVPCGVSFGSPEQKLGTFRMDRPWETCAVTNGYQWIWNGGKDIKSVNNCVQMLVGCAVGDGNLLLNFGPEPDGALTPKIEKLYQGIGKFLKKYGESIRKTRGGPYKPGNWGGATRNGKTVYLHITQRWVGDTLELPELPAKVVSAELLTGGEVECKQTDGKLIVKIDPKFHDDINTIVKLTIDKDSMSIEPIETVQDISLTTDSVVTASSSIRPTSKKGAAETIVSYSFESGKLKKEYGEESDEKEIKISKTNKEWSEADKKRILGIVGTNHRGHFWRFWLPKKDDKQPWIALDLGRLVTFSKVGIRELYGQIRGFEIQAKQDGKWTTFYKAETLDTLFVDIDKTITAQEVRLVILGNNGEIPSIVSFDLFK